MLRVYTLSPFLVFAKDTNASRIWGAYTRDPARILPQSRLSQIVFGEAHRHNSSIGSRGTDSPPSSKERKGSADKGYLEFTKASLYKLTLPLFPPSKKERVSKCTTELDATARKVDAESSLNDPQGAELDLDGKETGRQEAWEQLVEMGNYPVSQSARGSADGCYDESDPCSVIFLLHSGQPLSYIANLIRAERLNDETSAAWISREGADEWIGSPPRNIPPVSFHTRLHDDRRWSPSTGIGDFLREAARVGSFIVRIGNRRVVVNVPSFEDRTRFLRASLHSKTADIERLARLKDQCDRIAHKATQRMALGGAVILGMWWVTVGVLTFNTGLGWDTMEPITYLTGLGTVISGYLWFLWHNREVSYRSVLTETTSRRQQKLYVERGFDVERYHELIDEVKELRKAIKRVAWDYELTWDQGNTSAGKHATRALGIIRNEEGRENKGVTGGMESERGDE